MPWEKKTMVSYQSAGEVLKSAQPTLKTLCADGTFTAEECLESKDAYNAAVSAYKIMGDAAIIAIDTGDQSSYVDLQKNLGKLLADLAKYTEKE